MNILKRCEELKNTGKDCFDYAQILHDEYEGDILCLKSKGFLFDFLRIPHRMNKNSPNEYLHHFVFVSDGLVYDIKHENIGIDLDDYLKLVTTMTAKGIRADRTLSTYTFNLPTSRLEREDMCG